jgi:hypothetical protein
MINQREHLIVNNQGKTKKRRKHHKRKRSFCKEVKELEVERKLTKLLGLRKMKMIEHEIKNLIMTSVLRRNKI